MAEYKKVCKVCGKEFVANNHKTAYCSELCRAVGNSEASRKAYMKKVYGEIKESLETTEVTACAMCGKKFKKSRNKKYCSEKCAWTAKQIQSQRKSKFRFSANGTLCWRCRWATGKDGHCPWARSLTPVEGWKVIETKLKVSEGTYTQSFIVKECPLFSEG